jgi:hypothetical protein
MEVAKSGEGIKLATDHAADQLQDRDGGLAALFVADDGPEFESLVRQCESGPVLISVSAVGRDVVRSAVEAGGSRGG